MINCDLILIVFNCPLCLRSNPGPSPEATLGIFLFVVFIIIFIITALHYAKGRQQELERLYHENPNDPVVRYIFLSNRFGNRETNQSDLAAL
jgi:hypothetical protein